MLMKSWWNNERCFRFHVFHEESIVQNENGYEEIRNIM